MRHDAKSVEKHQMPDNIDRTEVLTAILPCRKSVIGSRPLTATDRCAQQDACREYHSDLAVGGERVLRIIDTTRPSQGAVAFEVHLSVANGQQGDIGLVRMDPLGYDERGRIRPLGGQTCSPPILADSKLIVRNKLTLACADLR
jgi:hypothetical protein